MYWFAIFTPNMVFAIGIATMYFCHGFSLVFSDNELHFLICDFEKLFVILNTPPCDVERAIGQVLQSSNSQKPASNLQMA